MDTVLSSPLMDYLEAMGYKTEITDGRKIIRNYDDINNELRSLHEGVGLRNISHYGITELRGNDVLDYLHRIGTNSLRELKKENVGYTLLTTEKGRIIDFVTVLNFESHHLLFSSPENKQKVVSWINKYIISDDVTVAEGKGKYNLLELLGPQAESFITLVCGNVINNILPNTFKIIHTEGLLFFLANLKDFSGRNKYWIISDEENAKRITKFMRENKGIFEFSLIGEDAYNIYRVEQGIPASPGELSDEFNPPEVKLLGYVDFKKGCYIGQEVIARLDTYDKVQKYLAGVSFDQPVEGGMQFTLYDEEAKEAGKITSVVHSPKCKKQIGLAIIRRAYINEGTKLFIKDPAAPGSANGATPSVTVKTLPFRK